MFSLMKTVAVLSAGTIATTGLVALSAPPAAAAGCSGLGCALQDPVQEGCAASSSRQTSVTADGVTGTLVIEYSRACNSNWVTGYLNQEGKTFGWQIEITASTWDSQNPQHREETCMGNPAVGDPVKFDIDGSLTEQCDDPYNGNEGWPVWTDMVDGTHVVEGIIDLYDMFGHFQGEATTSL